MEATLAPYTLKVRFGTSEFDGTGEKESVREDYARFLELQQLMLTHSANGHTPAAAPKANEVDAEDDDFTDPVEGAWDRAYLRKGDKLSLHVLPTGKTPNSDTLLLLVYGFQTLLGQEAVRSVDLMDAAQQSGIRIDRIDRNLAPDHRKLIIKGGTGKGSRYSLNNRGLKVAQDILDKLFD